MNTSKILTWQVFFSFDKKIIDSLIDFGCNMFIKIHMIMNGVGIKFMAGSLNRVFLIGNVGRDPEIRSTQDNREIASFSLATSETWKDKVTGEKKEKVEWHRVVVFSSNLVNLIKNYVHKGSKLYIEGSLQTRKWNDNTGVEKFSTEIVLQQYNGNIVLLDGKSSDDNNNNYSGNVDNSFGSSNERSKATYQTIKEIEEDDIPF